MRRIWIAGALIAFATGVGGCLGSDDSDKAGGEEQPDAVVLTLANHDPDTFDLDDFASEVARQSNGSVRIEFKNDWRAGEIDNERGTIEDVRDGTVDLAKVSARTFDLVRVNSFQPLVAPFAVDSYTLEREVLASPLSERMLRGVEQLDLVGIALLPGELRKPLGITRPLVAASDYRGATIGTRPSDLGARTFRALEASPENYAAGGDIASFDGTELGLTGIEGERYDGPARTLAANVSLWPRALVVVMNEDAYDALSENQREALRTAGRTALDPAIEGVEALEKEALGVLCARGELDVRSASPSQLATLRSATRSLSPSGAPDPAGRAIADEIAAMRADVDPEPAPACPAGDGESAAPSGVTTPVDGLWSMEITEDDLAQFAPADQVLPENWGEFTFAFGAGRFAFTTENRKACVWAYGTYAVKGDVVEWTVEDGGGEAPTGASNRPGEFFRFGWSRYRDQLTLTPVHGAISPELYRVIPWRRLEGEPSVDALSSRCPPPAGALR